MALQRTLPDCICFCVKTRTPANLFNQLFCWISGECLSNPEKCTAGLTFGLRFKLDDAAKNYKDEPHYIVDSGGSSRESRGFTLFIKDSKLYAVVSVPDEVWRVSRESFEYNH